jgi:hypothetical protein
MANCSIPNSTPATGRTSTTSSRRSRRLNSTTSLGAAISLTAVTELSIRKVFNAQRSTFNAQRSIQTVRRWTLDACSRFIGVGRSTFSFYGRVKGAWWPSRSSKPSSPCKRRGRFDSYPLRLDFSTLNAQRSTLNIQFRQLDVRCWTLSVGRFLLLNLKGGELRCRVSRFVN